MNNDIKYRDITVASSVRQHEGSHVGDDILLFDDITSVLIGKDRAACRASSSPCA